jgi:glutamate 5-kinase
MMIDLGKRLDGQGRIVVKVGSSCLTHQNGKLNFSRLRDLCRVLADVAAGGRQVVLVTSGAVAAGTGRLGMERPTEHLPGKQALAAIGQGLLMAAYLRYLEEHEQVGAQVLLTRDDFIHPERRANSLNTLEQLLGWGVIPVINENDTVATDEIKLGDNDTLSARVAVLVGADLLLILSDIDGLYTADPRREGGAELIPYVAEIGPDIERLAAGAGTDRGTGGMVTKLAAARLAGAAGIPTLVCSGDEPGIVLDIVSGRGRPGTLFAPAPVPTAMEVVAGE